MLVAGVLAGCDTGSSSDAAVLPNPGFIGDRVWRDANGNGLQDSGELGIGGVTVVVTDSLGGTWSEVTDANGAYDVNGLASGTYTVAVDPASPPVQGWAPSPPNVGNDPTIDSEASGVSVSLSPDTGGTQTIDFGFVPPPGGVGDLVWKDANGNGLQDVGEPGVAGVDLRLLDDQGAELAATTSDAAGAYAFVDLPAGDYSVVVAATPPGLVPTLCNVGPDDAVDNDCSPAAFTLAPGAGPDDTVDFGFAGTGSIGDRVWLDEDCDGLQDPGEPGLSGVDVVLTDPGGAQRVATTVGGLYRFDGLCAGTYTVAVDATTLPLGAQPAPCDVGPDDELDSECSRATVVLATDGTRVTGTDFGYCLVTDASIGDLVWHDLDGDGLQDPGEPGLPGAEVVLRDPAGQELARVATDAAGRYEFLVVAPGPYLVEVALPLCAVASPCDQGSDDTVDSDCAPVLVTLQPGQRDDTVDFGFVAYGTGSIGDFVWNDLDADGLQDPGERGLAGALVTLRGEFGDVLAVRTTGADGAYLFDGLCVGEYFVEVDVSGTGQALVPSPCDVGPDDTVDSDCSPAVVFLTPAGTRDLSVDFGYHAASPLEGLGPAAWRARPPEQWPPSLPPDATLDALAPGVLPGVTLIELLAPTPDGRATLAAEAAAAVLNATAGGIHYPLPRAEVLDRLRAALAGPDPERAALLRLLAEQNARGRRAP